MAVHRTAVQLDGDGQAPAGLVLAGRPPGQRAVVHVDLDDARPQLAADELFGQRILDVALDAPGAAAARRTTGRGRSLR